jgi:hypothetical protein
MNLQEMSTKSLLDLHNSIAQPPAGPKSFATKSKLIARIESIAAAGDLTALFPTTASKVVGQDMQPEAGATETAGGVSKTDKTRTGRGIGHLARELLLDAAGYSHTVIAEMVNAHIEGAQATAKSVRWYACKMRKEGTKVPERRRWIAKDLGSGTTAGLKSSNEG